jgi:hypothetical protein
MRYKSDAKQLGCLYSSSRSGAPLWAYLLQYFQASAILPIRLIFDLFTLRAMRKNARVSQPGGAESRSGECRSGMGLNASTSVNLGNGGNGATRWQPDLSWKRTRRSCKIDLTQAGAGTAEYRVYILGSSYHRA